MMRFSGKFLAVVAAVAVVAMAAQMAVAQNEQGKRGRGGLKAGKPEKWRAWYPAGDPVKHHFVGRYAVVDFLRGLARCNRRCE